MWPVIVTLTWGLLVVASFAASGRLLARALDRTLLDDLSLSAAVGIAGMTFVGGLLNLTQLATRGVLIALVVAPIALEAILTLTILERTAATTADSASNAGVQQRVITAAAVGLLLLVAAGKYLLSLGHPIHRYDDLPFYLAETVKFLQTGTLGIDPYHFRQMGTFVGQTFLAALVCSIAPLEFVYTFDPGICLLVMAGLVYFFLRRDLRVQIPLAAILTSICILPSTPMSTLGGDLSGPVLLLATARLMFSGIADSSPIPFGRLVLVALLLGSICVLKSTFLVFAGFFLIFWSLLTIWRAGLRVGLAQAIPVALLMALFMLPWMIQQYLSSGTLLYPLLGKGNLFVNHRFPIELRSDRLAYRLKFLARFATTNAFSIAPFITLIAAAILFFRSPSARSQSLFAGSLSAIVGSLVICFMICGPDRYAVATLYTSCLLPGLLGLNVATQGNATGLALACALFLFVGNQWPTDARTLLKTVQARAGGEKIFNRPIRPTNIEQLQSLTEPGKRILVSVSNAYLFDYRRNQIWNLDVTGMASPSPGMPLTREWAELQDVLDRKSNTLPPPSTSADFREYLVTSGADYVMFERCEPSMIYGTSPLVREPYLDRICVAVGTLGQDNLINLIQDRHVLYDDGNLTLLDLRQARQPGDPSFQSGESITHDDHSRTARAPLTAAKPNKSLN